MICASRTRQASEHPLGFRDIEKLSIVSLGIPSQHEIPDLIYLGVPQCLGIGSFRQFIEALTDICPDRTPRFLSANPVNRARQGVQLLQRGSRHPLTSYSSALVNLGSGLVERLEKLVAD